LHGAANGGHHEAAVFPYIGDGVDDFDSCLGAGGITDSWASRKRYAKRRLYTGFLRHMGASLSHRL
jgi:hypothetical protein